MKRKSVEEEVQHLITKKSRLEKDIAALVKSADNYAQQAEEKSDLTLVAKSNCMRKSSKEKSIELDTVTKLLTDKKQELLQ